MFISIHMNMWSNLNNITLSNQVSNATTGVEYQVTTIISVRCFLVSLNSKRWPACSSHLCDGQLQLNHVLRLGHWRLEGRVQQQDAIQVLPASHCIVIHKKHLVHCRKVLTPDTTTRFSWDRDRGQQCQGL